MEKKGHAWKKHYSILQTFRNGSCWLLLLIVTALVQNVSKKTFHAHTWICVCVVMSLRISLIDMSNFHQSCTELFCSKQKGKVILNFHVKEIQKIKRKQQGLETFFSEWSSVSEAEEIVPMFHNGHNFLFLLQPACITVFLKWGGVIFFHKWKKDKWKMPNGGQKLQFLTRSWNLESRSWMVPLIL